MARPHSGRSTERRLRAEMKSNTEGWSNKQLNDRIQVLEDTLEAVKTWKYERFLKMPVMGKGHISRADLDRLDKILEAEG